MLISLNDVELHPLSTGAEGYILFLYKNKLYLSAPNDNLLYYLSNINIKNMPKIFKTNLKIDFKNEIRNVFEKQYFDHLVKINEVDFFSKKEFIINLCKLNIELQKHNLLCYDIHYNNIFKTINGIYFIDINGISKITKDKMQYAFMQTLCLIHSFILQDYHGDNEHFNYDILKKINSPLIHLLNDSSCWQKIIDYILSLNKEIAYHHWSDEYANNYDHTNLESLKDKGKNFVKILNSIRFKTVTDFACNKGHYTFLAAQKSESVIGLDIIEGCIVKANQLAKENNINNVVFMCKDIKELIKDNDYEFDRITSDLCVALAITHHIKSIMTPYEFVQILTYFSKQYVILEDIDQHDEYHKCFNKFNWKLIERLPSYPQGRTISLYQKGLMKTNNLSKMSEEKIFKLIASRSTMETVKNVVMQMSWDDKYGQELIDLLNKGIPETRTIVYWLAKKIQPRNYLEIGTRRGWSLACAAQAAPECNLYSFDEWHSNYGGSPNPGPEFVKQELKKLNCKNQIEFISGNSHQTLPDFFKNNPDFELDLVLVDGDHTVAGATQDLMDVMPHIALNGAIIFDDIVGCARLDEVWDSMKENFPNFRYFSYTAHAPGVGFAIRVS